MSSISGHELYHGAWQNRLKLIIGPDGFMTYMRRSLQTIVLFEAKRCVGPRLPSLRPFQKRTLLLEQVYRLLDAMPVAFLNPYEKEQILWRTQKDGKQLDDVTAWKRAKIIERDLARTIKEFQRFGVQGRTHQESVNLFIQFTYKTVNDLPLGTLIEPPPQWEYLHNHTLATLRMYFIGYQMDPTFPPPVSTDDIPVPIERPPKRGNPRRTFAVAATTDEPFLLKAPPKSAQEGAELQQTPKPGSRTRMHPGEIKTEFASLPNADEGVDFGEETDFHSTNDSRFCALLAVRDQLDLLHKFKGILSEEEMSRRRKELYETMPPIPSPKDRQGGDDDDGVALPGKRKATD